LSGFPAAGRRLVLILESRLEKSGAAEFFNRFLELLGARQLMEGQVKTWLEQWDHNAQALLADNDEALMARHNYHHSGYKALLSEGRPEVILWNLLHNWGESVHGSALTANENNNKYFIEALDSLGLGVNDQMRRSEELEIYLDDIEEYLEIWADEHGA
jgi:hypothetical protein